MDTEFNFAKAIKLIWYKGQQQSKEGESNRPKFNKTLQESTFCVHEDTQSKTV